MSKDGQSDDRVLFAQYCAARAMPATAPVEIDALQLAAWVEHRLDEAASAEIEAILAADPVLLGDVLAASLPVVVEAVSEDLIARLRACVAVEAQNASGHRAASTAPSTAAILAYAPRPQRTARQPQPRIQPFNRAARWLSWGAIAASLLLVSAAGLGVGLTAGQRLTDSSEAAHYSPLDALDSTSWMSDEVG